MSSVALATASVAAQLTTAVVMHASTATALGSRPSATTFMQRSRSVTTPTRRRLCSFSMTGTMPTCSSRMMAAARCAVSDPRQHVGSFVIRCFTFMTRTSWSRVRRKKGSNGCAREDALVDSTAMPYEDLKLKAR